MSVIAVAARARRPTMLVRLLLLTALIIAGLLAMHALNTHGTAAGHGGAIAHANAAGHGRLTTPDTPSAHDVHAGHAAGAVASVAARVDHRVTSAAMPEVVVPSTDHAMSWMACVLALLVAVIVFVVAVGRRFPGARAQLLSSMLSRWSVIAHASPPPSLAVLCIRRT